MAKQISYKIIPLCLGVLAVSLLLGYVVLAWTEPTAGPPEGNVPPPLNTGINYQVKDGDLGLKTFYTDDINIGGTIPDLYSAHGNLIVKDSSNNITLEIDGSSGNMTIGGDITSVGDICLDNGCQSSWPSGGDSDWIISGNDIYSGVSGNVGIGTTVPGAKLSFNNLNDGTNGADGITWYNPSPTSYGIHRTSGSWLAPNYQQLRLGWSTGIILDPGSAYGKSYVDIQSGGLVVGNPTDGNKGAGTINAEKIYVQGSEISDGIEGGNVYWFDKVGILLKYGAIISCGTNWYGSSWIDVKCSGYTKAENGILYTKVVAEGSRSCNDYYISCNSGWQEGLIASCSNSNLMGPQSISASADTNRNQISVNASCTIESISSSASCSSVEWK